MRRIFLLCNKNIKCELYKYSCGLISKHSFQGKIIKIDKSNIKYFGYNENMIVIKSKDYLRLSVIYKKEPNYCEAAMLQNKDILAITNTIKENKEALAIFKEYLSIESELEKRLCDSAHNIDVYLRR